MTFSVGDRVMVKNRALLSYDVPDGTMGTVNMVDTSYSRAEARVNFDATPGRNPLNVWVYQDNLDPASPADITDLDTFKRVVVKHTLEHKRLNSWCESAEMLLLVNDLGAYMPQRHTVEVTYRVRVNAERDLTMDQAHDYVRQHLDSAQQVRDGARVSYLNHTTTARQPLLDGYDVETPTPAGETLAQFKERFRVTAMAGAQSYGVSGVPALLESLGINPDVPYRDPAAGLTVTVTIPTDLPDGADPVEYARGLFALAGVEGLTVEAGE